MTDASAQPAQAAQVPPCLPDGYELRSQSSVGALRARRPVAARVKSRGNAVPRRRAYSQTAENGILVYLLLPESTSEQCFQTPSLQATWASGLLDVFRSGSWTTV